MFLTRTLLAEGIDVREGDMALRESRGDEPARYRGPRRTAVKMEWQGHADETVYSTQGRNFKP